MIIEIKYRDKLSWSSVGGLATNWTNYSRKYKDDRVQPIDIAPEIVPDIWNGLEHEVQHVRWDSYSFEIFIKESEIHSINQMRSCSDIVILEYSENAAGLILNKTYTLDLQKSDYFNISEPERIDKTSAWKVLITFRTNRTIINKAIPLEANNSLSLNLETNIWALNYLSTIPGKLTALNGLNIASLNNGVLQKYTLISGTWVATGNSKSISGLGTNQAITSLDSDSVVVMGDGDGILSKYTYSNSIWTLVGNALDCTGSYTAPTICALSSSRVAVYDTNYANLYTLDFDGSDWTLVGNPLSITSASSVYICKLTSSKIAMMDLAASIRDYDFDGTDWTVNQNITLISVGNGAICRLSDSRIASYVENSGNLRSYELTSDWAMEAGTVNLGYTGSSLAGLGENEVFLSATTSGSYSYGEFTYYSDFDVLNWNKQTESIIVDWYDGTRKILQTIEKNGYQLLLYLTDDELNSLLDLYKSASIFKINSTVITEPEIEPAQIAQDLYKVVFRGIYQTVINDFDSSPNNTYNLRIVSGATYNFYTDYPPVLISEAPVFSNFSNSSGVNTPVKRISKTVKQVKFFLSEAKAFSLKLRFELWGTVTLDGVAILETREVTPNKIGVDLYEVTVDCLISGTVTP